MKTKKFKIKIELITIIIATLAISLLINTYSWACDIAVVSASVSSDGRPFIWKNRDHPDSYKQEIRYHESENPEVGGVITIRGEMLPISNIVVSSGGVNGAGFAICNTTVYERNPLHELVNGNTELMDYALNECTTIDEFEYVIAHWHEINPCSIWPWDLGRWVISGNFAVIDANGGAALFEAFTGTEIFSYCSEIMYEKFDANTDPNGFINRTNSHQWTQLSTDTPRELRAYQMLLDLKESNDLSYRTLMQDIAKDVCGGDCNDYNDNGIFWDDCESDLDDPENYNTRYCISRNETNLSLVVHGIAPGEDPRLSTFWCALGEPSLSVSIPYFVSAENISFYAWADSFDREGNPKDTDSSCLLNRANDRLEVGDDASSPCFSFYDLYSNNGYLESIDKTVNYNDLLRVQQWTLPLEDFIIDKTEDYLDDMRIVPSRITAANLYNLSHYCAEFAYNNYTNCSSEYFPWNFTKSWDLNPPTVLSTNPKNNAKDTAITINISAVFNESLNPDTINNSTFILSDDSGNINGELNYDEMTRKAIFIPESDLDYLTSYTARITSGIEDLDGNPLLTQYRWSFITIAPEDTPPDEEVEEDQEDQENEEDNEEDKEDEENEEGQEYEGDEGGSSSNGGAGCNLFANTTAQYSKCRPILPGIINNLILMLVPFSTILLHRIIRRKIRKIS